VERAGYGGRPRARALLLWIEDSADVPWTFIAENPQVLAPGLWLAFAP